MNQLQIRLFGPYFSSFLVHSYGYEPANELKSVLKHPNFRFGPYSPTVSQETGDETGEDLSVQNQHDRIRGVKLVSLRNSSGYWSRTTRC